MTFQVGREGCHTYDEHSLQNRRSELVCHHSTAGSCTRLLQTGFCRSTPWEAPPVPTCAHSLLIPAQSDFFVSSFQAAISLHVYFSILKNYWQSGSAPMRVVDVHGAETQVAGPFRAHSCSFVLNRAHIDESDNSLFSSPLGRISCYDVCKRSHIVGLAGFARIARNGGVRVSLLKRCSILLNVLFFCFLDDSTCIPPPPPARMV
jgi:hypothetical protein